MALKKRAYSDEEKQQREQMIIDAAQHLLMEKSFHSINMSEIARTANLAKGTVYLYFQTKEELFLTVFQRKFGEWVETAEAKLRNLSRPVKKEQIVDILIDTTAGNRQLIRLAALSNIIFEHNITYEKAIDYKLWLHEQTDSLGKLLEQLLQLEPQQGAILLYRLYVFVIGLENVANPSSSTLKIYANHPSMKLIDFETELRALVTMLINAL